MTPLIIQLILLHTQESSSDVPRQLSLPESGLIQNVHRTLLAETEICSSSLNSDDSQQYTTRTPYLDTVSTSTVNITFQITFDSIWDAVYRMSE